MNEMLPPKPPRVPPYVYSLRSLLMGAGNLWMLGFTTVLVLGTAREGNTLALAFDCGALALNLMAAALYVHLLYHVCYSQVLLRRAWERMRVIVEEMERRGL
jgi:hypothetical protein